MIHLINDFINKPYPGPCKLTLTQALGLGSGGCLRPSLPITANSKPCAFRYTGHINEISFLFTDCLLLEGE